MLVLSRERDQKIMIGDEIEVTIVDIRGDKVKLGINAPNSVPVHRKEVYDAIQRQNREKGNAIPDPPRYRFDYAPIQYRDSDFSIPEIT